MALPIFFPVNEDIIDSTELDAYGNANLPIIKSAASNKNGSGASFIHPLLSNGGTVIVSRHTGNDDNRFYNTTSAIQPNMALLYDSNGEKVTPIYSQAVTFFDSTFNFAGVALSSTAQTAISWDLKHPPRAPTPRYYAAMAFDGISSHVTLFGGTSGSTLNDTWEYDGVNWVQKTTATTPSTRIMHAMTYDAFNERVFMYGGSNESNTGFAETWEWDTLNWLNRSTGSPGALVLHTLTFGRLQPGTISDRSVSVLFGGQINNALNGTINDSVASIVVVSAAGFFTTGTLFIQEEQITYTGISGGNTFTGCTRGANGTDATSHSSGTLIFAVVNNTWEWNASTWTQAAPVHSPALRFGHAAAFDSNRSKLIIFGGSINYDGYVVTEYNDTWEYDGVDWTQVISNPVPPSRFSAQMVYDPVQNITVLFGGFTISPDAIFGRAHAGHGFSPGQTFVLNDTWHYDGIGWKQVSILGPSSRAAHVMNYDAAQDSIVLFGGIDETLLNFKGDTWQLNSSMVPVLAQTSGEATVYYDATGIYPINIGNVIRTSGSTVTITTNFANTFISGAQFELTTLSGSDDPNFASGTKTITAVINSTSFTYTEAGANASNVKPLIVRTLTAQVLPVLNDFVGPSAIPGTITSVFDGHSPVFGCVIASPVIDPATSNLLQTTLNGTEQVGLVKIKIGAFFGFIPPVTPTITTFTPSSATVGSTILMTGAGFLGVLQVFFNGTSPVSASFGFISNNQLFITIPAGAQTGTISLVSGLGTTTTGTNFFVIPSITSVVAVNQSVGAAVTIHGHTFTYVTSVNFNGTDQPVFTIVNDTQITTTIPAGATTGTLTVTDPDGYATFNGFSVIPPPVIDLSGIAPLSGATASFITVTGSGFLAPGSQLDGYGTVDFLVVSTTLNGGLSSGVTTVTVHSTTGFFSSGIIIIDAEQISYSGTTPTTFTGCVRGFNGTTDASHSDGDTVAMTTNGDVLNITRTVFNDTQIGATVPSPGPAQPSASYFVRVTTNGGTTTSTQSYLLIARPTFPVPPSHVAFAPSSGAAGTLVDVYGQYGFAGITNVSFDGYAAASFTLISDNHIQARVPIALGTVSPVPIRLIGPGGIRASDDSDASGSGVTSPQDFTILQQPLITSFTASGASGTTINVTGTNFLSLNADGYVFFFMAQATANSGAVTRSGSTVSVTTLAPHGFANNDFVLVNSQASPPTPGPVDANFPIIYTQVTVTGLSTFTYVQAGSSVSSSVSISFVDGGQAGTASFSIVNNTTLNVIVPAGSTGITSGPITVVAGTTDPLFDISTTSFTYLATPSISGLNYTSGGYGIGGVTNVVITGTNLSIGPSAPSVTFGGVAASVASFSPTLVTVTVPVGGGNGLALTTSGGTATTTFTVVQPPVVYSSFPSSMCYQNNDPITVSGTNFIPSGSIGHNIFFYHQVFNTVTPTSYSNTQIVVNNSQLRSYFNTYIGSGSSVVFIIYVFVYYNGGYYAVSSPQPFSDNFCIT